MTFLSLLESVEVSPLPAAFLLAAASLFAIAHTDWMLRTRSPW